MTDPDRPAWLVDALAAQALMGDLDDQIKAAMQRRNDAVVVGRRGGMGPTAIARALGMSVSSIHVILREARYTR